ALNKRIILTGATGGVGREITKVLKRIGAQVVIVSRDINVLKNLAQGTKGKGCLFPIACDFNDLTGVDNFVGKALSCLGGQVDVLINSVGVGHHSKIEDIVPSELEEVFYVNSLGPILLTSKIIPYLRKSPNAHVINI